jgi:hypothetical protein
MATTVTDKECEEYAASVSVSPACLPIKPSKILSLDGDCRPLSP